VRHFTFIAAAKNALKAYNEYKESHKKNPTDIHQSGFHKIIYST